MARCSLLLAHLHGAEGWQGARFQILKQIITKSHFPVRSHEAQWGNTTKQTGMTTFTVFILLPGLCSCCSLLLKYIFQFLCFRVKSANLSRITSLRKSPPAVFPGLELLKTTGLFHLCDASPGLASSVGILNVIDIWGLIPFRESVQLHVLPGSHAVPGEWTRGMALDKSWAN